MNTAEQSRELFRLNLLRQLNAVAGRELRLPALKIGLVIEGFDSPPDAELQAELQYLADKGLVSRAEAVISPENSRWRITASGRDHIAKLGIA